MNFIRRFVSRIGHMDDPIPIQERKLAFGWSEYNHSWIVWSRWTGEVCVLKENRNILVTIRNIADMIRDFKIPEEVWNS